MDSEKIKKTIEEQLAAVMAAPIPFTVSVLIAAGLIWGAMQWAYGGIIANRDATISLVTVQRDDYLNKLKGASPEEAARQLKSLQDEIDRQKRLLDKLANPPHDPLGLYQDGVAVAAARMANLNPSDAITLQMVGSRSPLDMNRTFEFREFVVLCSGEITGNIAMGPQSTLLYNTVFCKIRK